MKIALIIPPFNQINSPYPSIYFLKSYIENNSEFKKINTYDLNIDTFLSIFNSNSLKKIFKLLEDKAEKIELPEEAYNFILNKEDYINNVDMIVKYLQNRNNSLKYRIIQKNIIPQGLRFKNISNDNEEDKALLFSTYFIEDLSDLIHEVFDNYFFLGNYYFHRVNNKLLIDDFIKDIEEERFIDDFIKENIDQNNLYEYDVIGISVPFQGNFYYAIKIAKFLKEKNKNIKICLGGGLISTEMKDVDNKKLFSYIDAICYDNGEESFLAYLRYLNSDKEDYLTNCKIIKDGGVIFYPNKNGKNERKFSYYPDYSEVNWDKYLCLSAGSNPMHSLWSNSKWKKMLMAYGCYWKKCKFCDTKLDYIKTYKPCRSNNLIEFTKKVIADGKNNIHFVDESMPPALMKEYAYELINSNINLIYWGNIRFEKVFDYDLIRLLKKSGLIAVTGGIESPIKRLMNLINKGNDIEDIISICYMFKKEGIFVHTYLMYGIPTQSEEELIDSIEIVRQLYLENIIDSSFWHRFTLTKSSIIAENSEMFGIKIIDNDKNSIISNDLDYIDKNSKIYNKYKKVIDKISFYYQRKMYLKEDLSYFFDFKIPNTNIPKDFVKNYKKIKYSEEKYNRLLWLGGNTAFEIKRNKILIKGYDKLYEIQYNNKKEENVILAIIEKFDVDKSLYPDIKALNNDLKVQLRKAGLVYL